MAIIFSLLLYAGTALMITDANNGSIGQTVNRYQTLAQFPPGSRLDHQFRDSREIPGLVLALMENAKPDNLLAWIRRLLAGSANESDFFHRLSMNNRSNVCAHSFKPGEPAYQCSTCGVDPTCIQCAACFRLANHVGHDVKMAHAGGGGICDCGDSSSWAVEGFCSQHQGLGNVDEVDITWLPDHTVTTFTTLLESLIQAILHIDHHYAIDGDIINNSPSPQFDYCGFIHNDDVHSFNDVVSMLESICGLPERVGLNIALKVDRYGRAIFAVGSESHCQSLVEGFSEYNIGGSVERRPALLLQEEGVVEALNIVTGLCHKSDALRRLACDIMGRDRGDTVQYGSYMTALMHASFIFYRNLASAMAPFHFQLFISVSFKERFTLAFTKHYSALISAIGSPSHKHHLSVLDYSVQMYTIPDMVLRLCRSHNLLRTFLLVFQKLIESQLTLHSEQPNNEDEIFIVNALRDLVYIVANQGVCRYIYEENPELINLWLECIRRTDGLDPQVRQRGVHVDYESVEWWYVFRLTLRLQPVSKIFLEEFSKLFVAGDLDRIFIPMFRSLLEPSMTSSDTEQTVDLGNGLSCPVYDITVEPVSMHFPFTRFLIELSARFCLATSCPLSEVFPNPSIFMGAIDNLFRAVAFFGHIRAGLWVLNGNMLMQQAATYERIQARDCMIEPDILALQCSAVVMGPKPFLLMLSYRFLLHKMFFPGQISAPAFDESSIEQSKIFSVIEHFMQVLVTVIVERARITVDKGWGLRREIVHWLMTKDLAHSDLLHQLGIESPSADVKQVLSEVAHFLTPRDLESGKYQVRKDVVADIFDPFFAKYSDSERETATAVFESQNHPGPVLPYLPPYCTSFINLYHLSVSIELYQILHQILSNPLLTSSRLFLSCLRLIGAGLRDAQSSSDQFPVDEFIYNLTRRFNLQSSVFELLCTFLRDDIDKAKDHSKYIRLLVDGIGSISPQCHDIAQSLLSDAFVVQQRQQLALKAEERRRRRDAARAAALGAIQNQIVKFSRTNNESLQEVANIDENDDGALHVCILCRSSESQQDMGLLAWIGQSHLNDMLMPSASRCCSRHDHSEMFTYVYECGHVMHVDCFTGYMQSLYAKEAAREHYEGLYVIDLAKGEFICPLCKSHGNILLPNFSYKASLCLNPEAEDNVDLSNWIETSIPDITQRMNSFFSDHSISDAASSCMEMFESRLGNFILNRSITELVAQSIALIEIQLRDDGVLSEKQIVHLRVLIAIAIQKMRSGAISSISRSLVPLNFAMTKSLRFLIECCLSFMLIGESIESFLKIVRIGFMVFSANSDRSEFNENQFLYAASLYGSASRLELFTLPFLRQVAILLSVLRPNDPLPNLALHSALLRYLNLTEPLSDLNGALRQVSIALPLAYVKPSLAALPQSFMALFDAATRVSCPHCGRVPVRPAVCLICGNIMCSSKDCVIASGALSFHTSEHLGDQGLFLSIKQGSVMLICNGFSCEFSSPYLDEHGEEDIGLQRGRPLFLDADRYEKLRQLVVRLEIGSSVSRKRSYQSSLLPRNAL